MGRSARQWDESDVRVRPNRRGSRPRTKERPKHEDAVIGRVVDNLNAVLATVDRFVRGYTLMGDVVVREMGPVVAKPPRGWRWTRRRSAGGGSR